jgi:beta-lactamase regulating signal transducer with metallopeptidase domain
MLAAFWKGMLVHLWQVTLFLAFLFVLERMLRRAPARIIHALWITGLVRLFVPLSPLKARLAGLWERIDTFSVPGMTVVGTILDPGAAVQRTAEAGPGTLGIGLAAVTAAWAVTSAVFLARTAREMAGLSTRLGDPLPSLDGSIAKKLERACEVGGIRPGHVRLTGIRLMPGVGGILRPRIVIPRALVESIDERGLVAVLAHEESHRRRRDPLRYLAARLALALFHFYPPVYVLMRRISMTAEYDCDERALRSGIGSAEYARAFMRTLRLGLEAGGLRCAALGDEGSLLEKRFKRILDQRRYRMTFWSRTVLALAVIALLAGFVVPGVTTAGEGKKQEHGDVAPELIRPAGPEYPKNALKYGYSATVLLKVTVAEDGKVAHAEVENIAVFCSDEDKEKLTEKQLDEISGAFNKASLQAVYKWEFKPGTVGGKPAKVEVKVPVKFKLE